MPNYKGIEFAEGYNKPFADFKTEFEQTHVFRNIPHLERDQALIEAHKIAIGKRIILTPEIEVIKPKVLKSDGITSRTTTKSKETTTK